jgi:endonuclease III-like uncharacterized protein
MANLNTQFAAVLVKYLQAEKLNESKLVKEFIDCYYEESVEYIGIPEESTSQMIDFAKGFIKKKIKCTDCQFKERMVEISTSVAFIEQVATQIAVTSQRQEVCIYKGEC